MVPMMKPHIGDVSGEFVFVPLSIPARDIAYVEELVEKRVPLEDKGARGHVLSSVLERARERAGLQTSEREVFEAFQTTDYHYTNQVAEKDHIWTERYNKYIGNAAAGDVLAMAALRYCCEKGPGV